jgi:hypothetical protein
MRDSYPFTAIDPVLHSNRVKVPTVLKQGHRSQVTGHKDTGHKFTGHMLPTPAASARIYLWVGPSGHKIWYARTADLLHVVSRIKKVIHRFFVDEKLSTEIF